IGPSRRTRSSGPASALTPPRLPLRDPASALTVMPARAVRLVTMLSPSSSGSLLGSSQLSEVNAGAAQPVRGTSGAPTRVGVSGARRGTVSGFSEDLFHGQSDRGDEVFLVGERLRGDLGGRLTGVAGDVGRRGCVLVDELTGHAPGGTGDQAHELQREVDRGRDTASGEAVPADHPARVARRDPQAREEGEVFALAPV